METIKQIAANNEYSKDIVDKLMRKKHLGNGISLIYPHTYRKIKKILHTKNNLANKIYI